MKSFGSDNNSGVHPQIMDAIIAANSEHAVGYGNDIWTEKAMETLRGIFGADIGISFVFNGTGANSLALQVTTRSFHSVIATETAHINVDECGAPTKLSGCAIVAISTPDGKLTPELIEPKLLIIGNEHHSQPKVVYLSQVTELGTAYTPSELKAICDLAHKHNMYVHMDGARLANACAFLGLGMKELTCDCGIDILSLGGTKNGMMMGEVVISFRPQLSEYLKFHRKQSAQLYSKMRYHSAQFLTYLSDNLWLKNATHANEMALKLYDEIKMIPKIKLVYKLESNALFLSIPREMIAKLQKDFFFYIWNEERNEIRLVCSWDTSVEEIELLLNAIKA